jgi:hypothetical protein
MTVNELSEVEVRREVQLSKSVLAAVIVPTIATEVLRKRRRLKRENPVASPIEPILSSMKVTLTASLLYYTIERVKNKSLLH